jgi:hypothetical protein
LWGLAERDGSREDGMRRDDRIGRSAMSGPGRKARYSEPVTPPADDAQSAYTSGRR